MCVFEQVTYIKPAKGKKKKVFYFVIVFLETAYLL